MTVATVSAEEIEVGMMTFDGDVVLTVERDEWEDDVWVEFESGDSGYLTGSLFIVVD